MDLEELIRRIPPLDEAAMAAARARQNRLTKPPGSLGRLEELAVQLAGITGQALPRIQHKVIAVMAGDHGVVAEGVSAYPQAVTAQMVANFLRGGAAINVLARHVDARVVVADLGVATELPDQDPLARALVRVKVAPGTGNIAQGPAMSREQAVQALLAGAQVVEQELARGLDILATGDMGIGNTTPSAAIAAAFTGRPPQEIVGRGTGLDEAGLAHKAEVVRRALAVNRPSAEDGLDVLAKVGGFEIGGIAGAMLAAAGHRRPVMVDGFISTAAAMVAVALAPQVRPYLIAAHHSVEQGHGIMLEWLRLQPLLKLEMRLGEGTGAALGISLAEAACKLMAEMATFDEAGVSERA
ncbi:nicotinate-nucleotide--dimethylbenzimidazole phosphoribosyltransferase [Litorilinea aerophila]|uniref:Nicotinate-nucleotide--dimethylbenzimidazole phosphoribosyltransferase n=1 Tax=Litorilinea aerophila TaxID=1204385 RepID=A0A540VLC3_9CHLR|nr:nicotinate-nucleotide--dimethylbenzimidazole phosphoribosyltransferase [Litorilinea aerophila]MCC9075396.1 nicotinate-nucleotide--dimethylbenzimidazole phosphoribosyltransferase [Litorilinea aerophila]